MWISFVRRADIQGLKKTDKILFLVILVIAVVFLIVGGIVYWKAKSVLKIFSSGTEIKQNVDKVILGKIIELDQNSMIIQSYNGTIPIEYKISFLESTKVYQDFNEPDIKVELSSINKLELEDEVAIGLNDSKNKEILYAEVIHILTENIPAIEEPMKGKNEE